MSNVLTQSVLSLQYVLAPISFKVNGIVTSPTGDVVKMAFPIQDVDPTGGDWKTASWETNATVTPNLYFARCLVGPSGTVALAVGRYDIWVQVTDVPEIVTIKVGTLVIE